MRIFVVDDRIREIILLWDSSGCASNHELLPLEPFYSIEQTCSMVNTLEPDVVLVGYGLGKTDITGADVARSLRKGGYSGYIVANSGGGAEQFNRAGVEIDDVVNRNPRALRMVADNLTKRK